VRWSFTLSRPVTAHDSQSIHSPTLHEARRPPTNANPSIARSRHPTCNPCSGFSSTELSAASIQIPSVLFELISSRLRISINLKHSTAGAKTSPFITHSTRSWKQCLDVGDPFTQRSESITAKDHLHHPLLQRKCGRESEIESTKKRMSTSDERVLVLNSCEMITAETRLARWS